MPKEAPSPEKSLSKRSPSAPVSESKHGDSISEHKSATPQKESLPSARSSLSPEVKPEPPQRPEVNVFKPEDTRTLDTATFDTTGLDSSTTLDSNVSVPNTAAKPFVLDTSEMSMEFKPIEDPKPKAPDPGSFGLGDSLFADAHNSTRDSGAEKKTSIAWIDDSFE